jgi:hypothetical protein
LCTWAANTVGGAKSAIRKPWREVGRSKKPYDMEKKKATELTTNLIVQEVQSRVQFSKEKPVAESAENFDQELDVKRVESWESRECDWMNQMLTWIPRRLAMP